MSRAMLDEYLLVMQLLIGLVFLTSSVSKLGSWNEFVGGLKEYNAFPESRAAIAAMLLVMIEIAIGLSHLTGFLLDILLPVTITTLVLLGLVTSVVIAQDRDVPCLCFGGDSKEVVSAATLLRQAALIALVILELACGIVPSGIGLYEIELGDYLLAGSSAGAALIAIFWLSRFRTVLVLKRKCLTCQG